MPFVLAIDQGTTSSRVVLFDEHGVARHIVQRELPSITPEPGWVEQDARALYRDVVLLIRQCMVEARVAAADVLAVAIANQRETTVVWDRHTGAPLHNAVVWQSKQSAAECELLVEGGHAETFAAKTGLRINPYFSCSKIMWLMAHVDGLRERMDAGDALVGTVDTWLLWNLTRGRSHLTDVTNASRTMLFNIHTLRWDDELLAIARIPRAALPRVCDSADCFGAVEDVAELRGVPVLAMMGDQHAALFGHGVAPHACKCTYGTGSFVMKNVGASPAPTADAAGLLSTVAWKVGSEVAYATEGSVLLGGGAIRWLQTVGVLRGYDEIEACLRASTTRLFFVPAFQGLGTPYWDDAARGMLIGIDAKTRREDIVRAAVEAVALQAYEVVGAMGAVSEMRVDGGVSRSDHMLQLQADLCRCRVVRLAEKEITALGAAMMAGCRAGLWTRPQLETLRRVDRVFEPAASADDTRQLVADWLKAVKTVQFFSH